MVEGHGAGELEDYLGAVGFGEVLAHATDALPLHDFVKHLAVAPLDDEVKLPVTVNGVEQPHDVRVPIPIVHLRHGSEQLDLANDAPLDLGHLLQLVLVIDLDGDNVARLDVQGLSDHGVGALPQHLAKAVLGQASDVGRLDEVLVVVVLVADLGLGLLLLLYVV